MRIPLQIDTLVPIIVAPYCLSIGITVLLRIKSIKSKTETIIFFILCLAAAAWSISPLVNQYYRIYGWITAVIITNVAMVYMLLITSMKLIKIFLPLTLFCTSAISYLLITGAGNDRMFPVKFAILIFPLLLFMNGVIYYYFIKHKTKFHLTIAFMTTFMILGGFYDTFKMGNNWPLIPAATLGCFGFVVVLGYHILARGYLHAHGWRDYAIELEQKEKLLKEKFNILKKANLDSVLVLSQTIEAKDPYTRGHCLRVKDFALAIGKELKFSKDKLLFLELAALLHDIGKIGVPGVILNKKEKLTDIEFTEIKKHPDIGADIIQNVKFFKPIIPMVRYHHEFYNGKGYPKGLKDGEIPLESRILAVGDTFDAMTSDRPYRRAFSVIKALSIIKEVAGTQLDPNIVNLFVNKKIYKIKHSDTQKIELFF
ncbi:MAG: HD-GYP domain-containing protein [Spirochaetes bacterium]|nr:HD-GYP domain-containing protein [Spirochaetota bacterium]